MPRKITVVVLAFLALSACSSSTPKIVQTSSGSPEVRLQTGLATQIELPESRRVQSVVAGNPSLVTTESSSNVVNLIAKGAGETNLIIRAVDDDGDARVYQYRVIIQER